MWCEMRKDGVLELLSEALILQTVLSTSGFSSSWQRCDLSECVLLSLSALTNEVEKNISMVG